MFGRDQVVSNISQMRLRDVARVDCGRLEELIRDLGDQGAEQAMARALEEIAIRLNRLDRCWRRGDRVRLGRGALDLADVAGRVGLVGLSRCSETVGKLSLDADDVTLSATQARMMRVGEASLMSAWDIRNMSV